MLNRLARFSFRKRRLVLAVWILGLVVLQGVSGAIGPTYKASFSLPDSESKTALDTIKKEFGAAGQGGFAGTIVVKAAAGLSDPAVKAYVDDAIAKASSVDDRVRIVSPYSAEGKQQVAQQGPLAGKIGYAQVRFPPQIDNQSDGQKLAKNIKDAVPEAINGVQLEFGGEIFGEFKPPESEAYGVAAAIVILILSFGSVLAMGLPIGIALFGIGCAFGLIVLGSRVMTMPDFTVQMAAMIGLGVGIDYALFIVTRYREGLHKGYDPETATVIAIDTAGRAVVFAGITVIISLMGMFLMGVSFVQGLAVGGSLAVLMTMIASITLLPALLGFARERVELTRWRGMIAAVLVVVAIVSAAVGVPAVAAGAAVLAVLSLAVGSFLPALKRPLKPRAVKPMRETFFYKLSRSIQHRPWPFLFVGLAILVVLAVPTLNIRLGLSDDGNAPKGSTTRKAYDLLAEGFGPGYNGQIQLVAKLPAGTGLDAVAGVAPAVQATADVAAVIGPIPNDPNSPTAALWTVFPKGAPQDQSTNDLIAALRDDVLPKATAGTGVTVAVGGFTAIGIDFSEYLAGRLPLFIGAVLALSFLLLMAVFRSVLVPLKAVVLNVLSIGAAYGVVVVVFQWGWAKDLIGLGKAGPVDAWVPMMLFAIVFGLSMDYEVFLLSRMREEYDRTHDNASAVADGLATTARVITAAALIMVFVFGSFVLEPTRQIKLFGLGLAIAVFLDATVVRMILVPATMELLGDRNWWIPKWLDRVMPKLNVEGHEHEIGGTHPDPDAREPRLVDA